MADEKVKYQRSIVSFVDILGFKNLVSTRPPEEIRKVIQLKDDLKRLQWRWVKPIDKTRCYSFSDLIVNVTQMPTAFSAEQIFGRLFTEFVALGSKQLELAVQGVFVRGGVTIGDVYARRNELFGPGLVTAYELEQKKANWPIIAVDDQVVQLIIDLAPRFIAERIEGSPYPKDEEESAIISLVNLCWMISQTPEGTYFIDYFKCTAYEDSATGDMSYLIEDHKRAVEFARERYRHYKYDFVSAYHNDYCENRYPSLLIPDSPGIYIEPLVRRVVRKGKLIEPHSSAGSGVSL